jgi:hypothetical protein
MTSSPFVRSIQKASLFGLYLFRFFFLVCALCSLVFHSALVSHYIGSLIEGGRPLAPPVVRSFQSST